MENLTNESVKITLNGIPYANAQKMVQNFPGALKHPKTNIWFKKAFIDRVQKALDTENGDGIRVYFAMKDPTDVNSDNTVVIVSTKDNGPSPVDYPNLSKRLHLDYFDHDPVLLPLSDVTNEDDADGSAEGAYLYTDSPCPDDDGCEPHKPSFISCEDAKEWVTNLKGGHITTTSVWYGRAVIDEIKMQLDAATSAGIDADGVRIYFAKDNSDMERFIFIRTDKKEDFHEDDYMCYAHEFLGGNDHGEECPVFCTGVTLP